jgi:hypothetical protein|tara:strand:- start:17459 stop:17920 length:462 start_codon:yes stop_codon:yes gene_type:complete
MNFQESEKNLRARKVFKIYSDIILEHTGINIIEPGRQKEKTEMVKIFSNYSRLSLKQPYDFIGYYLKRTHASIINACQTYNDIYETEKEFREKSEFFIKKFNAAYKGRIVYPNKIELLSIIKESSETRCKFWLTSIKQALLIESAISNIINND